VGVNVGVGVTVGLGAGVGVAVSVGTGVELAVWVGIVVTVGVSTARMVADETPHPLLVTASHPSRKRMTPFESRWCIMSGRLE
jgi:hypothetical protein